jgi:hypothetical protein
MSVRTGEAKAARDVLLHVGGPLVLGALTYVLWPRGIVAETLGGRLGAPALHALLPRPPAWLLGHAADALWAYAMGAFVMVLWRDGAPGARRAWTCAAYGLVVLAELAQRLGWLPGTFDPLDLLVTSVAFGSAVLVTSTSSFLPRRRTA